MLSIGGGAEGAGALPGAVPPMANISLCITFEKESDAAQDERTASERRTESKIAMVFFISITLISDIIYPI
jgi:hypothetical protein